MAFISKEDPVVLNIMLTSKGRERLSTGNLTFKYFTIGDSEIDYNFINEMGQNPDANYSLYDSSILRPKDKNPKIISYIPRVETGSSYNDIDAVLSTSYDVVNEVDSLGFFIENAGQISYITESTHVKQPDTMVSMNTITGGTVLKLRKAPTYGNSVLEPAVGDYVHVKWTIDTNTTGFTINKSLPVPALMYKIVSKTGSLAANNLLIHVDRELPDLRGRGATGVGGALIFYSGITEVFPFPSDYLSESVLDFIQNYQCGIAKFPYWNVSIIYTEEIAGIRIDDRKFTQFKNSSYGGFVSYIQNQAPYYKKLGVIHYTNDSPANVYGEELNLKTSILTIPTIMWHKSSGTTMGLTLVATGDSKLLTGDTKSLDIEYYDLADISTGYVVGKIFNGLKLFVIEDQELLFAMSYKSNRSWTLPNYLLGTAGSNPCPPTVLPPSAPIMYELSVEDCDSLYISWSMPSGGVPSYNYYLYRKVNDGSWILYQEQLTDTHYLDEKLTDKAVYSYKVIADDQNRLLSQESNIVSHRVSCEVQPTTPNLNPILIDDQCNVFGITWSKSESEFLPITYTLYRKDNVRTDWIALDEQITDLYYVDNNNGNYLIDGRKYYYKVVAVDYNRIRSNESNTEYRIVNCGATTIPTTTEAIETIEFSYVNDNDEGIISRGGIISDKYAMVFDYDIQASARGKAGEGISSTTTAFVSLNEGQTWSEIDSVTAVGQADISSVTTESRKDSYMLTDVIVPEAVRIKIVNNYTDADIYQSGIGVITIAYVNSIDSYDSSNNIEILCPDMYVKSGNENAYIACSRTTTTTTTTTSSEPVTTTTTTLEPTTTTTIVDGISQIGFDSVSMPDGAGKLIEDNGFGQIYTITFSWAATATAKSRIDDGVNASTAIEVTTDGGENWITKDGVTASAPAGEVTITNSNTGTFIVVGVTDISKVWVRIVPEYIEGTKSGDGTIVIESVTVNVGDSEIVCNNRYTRTNLNTPTLDCTAVPINVDLSTFYCSGSDGSTYSIKTTCTSYSLPMSANECFCLHLNNCLCMNAFEVDSGSFACVCIKLNSTPIASSCLSTGNTYQAFDTSLMVCAGQTVEIYNQAFTSDVCLSGSVVSCTSILQIEQVCGHGLYQIGNTCQSVCTYTG